MKNKYKYRNLINKIVRGNKKAFSLFLCLFFTLGSFQINREVKGEEIKENAEVKKFMFEKEYDLSGLKFRFHSWEVKKENESSISLIRGEKGKGIFFLSKDDRLNYSALGILEKINLIMEEGQKFVAAGEGLLKDYKRGKVINVFNNAALISTSDYSLEGVNGKVGILIFFHDNSMFIASYMDQGFSEKEMIEVMETFAKEMIPSHNKARTFLEETIKKHQDLYYKYANQTSSNTKNIERNILDKPLENISHKDFNIKGVNLLEKGDYKDLRFYHPSNWKEEISEGIAYYSKEGMFRMELGGMSVYVDDNPLEKDKYSGQEIKERLMDLAQKVSEGHSLTLAYYGNPQEISILGNDGSLIVGPYTSNLNEGYIATLSFIENDRLCCISFILPEYTGEESISLINAFKEGLEEDFKGNEEEEAN